MTGGSRVWVLNLDAEQELEAGAQYQPSLRMQRIVARQGARLLGGLVQPGDIVLEEGALESDPRARGLPGLAWSPTPRALARLEAAGARPMQATAVEVLREVNARPFVAKLRLSLQEASFEKHIIQTLEESFERLAQPAPLGWLVRRTFGAAGRGRRRIRAGKPDAAEQAWLVASLRLGPLVIEPWLEITREYTRSAWLGSSGAVSISRPCFQATTDAGAWTDTTYAASSDLAWADDHDLEQSVAVAGAALHAAGYSGPFGIDAFRHYIPGTRSERLNPLSEINARFTMDWATAMSAIPGDDEAAARLTRVMRDD